MKKFTIFLLSAVLTIASSCSYIFDKRVKGDGNIVSQSRSISSFDGVRASGAVDVIVSQGSTHSVNIETDQNLMEYIEVRQDGAMLEVRQKRGYNLRPSKYLRVHVTAPMFKSIKVSGASNITSATPINNPEAIDLGVSGAGDIKMDITAPAVSASVSGSGNIILKGTARDFEADISGAGDARCYDMMAENTDISISGAGNAEVYASTKLDVRVSGAGSVRYKGNPSVTQKVSGAGSVSRAN